MFEVMILNLTLSTSNIKLTTSNSKRGCLRETASFYTTSLAFNADAEPFRQFVFDDDPGIGSGTGCDDDVDGDDVDGPQVNMQVSRQARAGAEEDRMDQVDGVRVVAQEGEDFVYPLRYRPTFPPVEEEEHRRQGIGHADRAELMAGEDCR